MYRQTIEKYPTGDNYYEGGNLEGLTPEEIAAIEMGEYNGEEEEEEEPIEPTPQPIPEPKPCSCKDKVQPQPKQRSWVVDAVITAMAVLAFIALIKMILK